MGFQALSAYKINLKHGLQDCAGRGIHRPARVDAHAMPRGGPSVDTREQVCTGMCPESVTVRSACRHGAHILETVCRDEAHMGHACTETLI